MDAIAVTWFPAESSAHASAEAPSDASRRAIQAWAEARGLVVTMPRTDASSSIEIDLTRGDEIEKELANARDALTRLDADAAEHALSRARSIARAHPELPHAAWLLAEIERGWAARWMRIDPVDPAAKLSLDPALLARFPEGYRHLAYLQTRVGYTVKNDLPGLEGPALDALYAQAVAWLNRGPPV